MKLADDVMEDDVFCNFCKWDAEQELILSDGNSSLTWWPTQGAENLLKRGYLDGMVTPCWVKLDKISIPESDEKNEDETEVKEEEQSMHYRNCIYCDKQVAESSLNYHLQKFHKDELIRCEVQNCASYLRSLQRRKLHKVNVHKKPQEWKKIPCVFCTKVFNDGSNYRQHVKKVHLDAHKCFFRGCLAYFHSRDQLNSHFEQVHKEDENAKLLKCQICNIKTSSKYRLKKHVVRYHSAIKLKCDECSDIFTSKYLFKEHHVRYHTFKECKLCQKNLTVAKFKRHFMEKFCAKCKISFLCAGKLQEHKKICKETVFSCGMCPKQFKRRGIYDYHMKIWHSEGARHLKNKAFGHKCEDCSRFYRSSQALNRHVEYVHSGRGFMSCEHCSKKFPIISLLKQHLAEKHDLIECKHKCLLCVKKYTSVSSLKKHILRSHSTLANERKKCRVCGNSIKALYLPTHMLTIHGIRERCLVESDLYWCSS